MKTVLFKEVVPGQPFITVCRLEHTSPIPIYTKLAIYASKRADAVFIKTGELLVIEEEEPVLILE